MMAEEILVSDLMQMSADELRSKGVIFLKDHENLTEEHIEKLKLLVNKSDHSRAINLEAVNQKLCELSGAEHADSESQKTVYLDSTSSTPDPDDPIFKAEWTSARLKLEHKAYQDLIQDGGRPSHRPNDSSFDYLDEPQTEIVQYWANLCYKREFIFGKQWFNWEEFRRHQDWRRRRYWKPKWFESFVRQVQDYLRTKGIEDDIRLLQDRKQQSQLQDWKEYQFWEFGKSDRVAKRVAEYAEKIKEAEKEKELQPSINHGSPAREYGFPEKVKFMTLEGAKHAAERSLKSRMVLLDWISEQLSIIASEQETATTGTASLNDHLLLSSGANLGKRKRSQEQDKELEDSRRHKVRFVEPSDACGSSSTDRPDHGSAHTLEIGKKCNKNTPSGVNTTGNVTQASGVLKREHGVSTWSGSSPKHDQAGSRLYEIRGQPVLSHGSLKTSDPGHGSADVLRTTTLDAEEAEFLRTKARLASSSRRCDSAPPTL